MSDHDGGTRRPGTLSIIPMPTAGARAVYDLAYDLVVFVGRFRPFHVGHLAVLRRALALGHRVAVFVGSCRQARSIRNPFPFIEVEGDIRGALTPEENARVDILPLIDRYNSAAWTADVQDAARSVAPSAERVCLIGHNKDASSSYLSQFPQWEREEAPNYRGLSATPIRDDYFADAATALDKWTKSLPANVAARLAAFVGSREYCLLVEENAAVRAHKEMWVGAPNEPDFVTADAVVLCAGHVLVGVRKGGTRPILGRGLLTLPGGYVRKHERIADATLRELRDDARIKVPDAVLSGSVRAREVFDSPWRDPRGRFISHTTLYHLADSTLPKVRSGYMWKPVAMMRAEPEAVFGDHAHITQTMLAYIR